MAQGARHLGIEPNNYDQNTPPTDRHALTVRSGRPRSHRAPVPSILTGRLKEMKAPELQVDGAKNYIIIDVLPCFL